MYAIHATGFTLRLPGDEVTENPETANGVSTYRFVGGGLDGAVEVIPLVGRTMPAGVGDLLNENIDAVALEINGTRTGTTGIQTVESLRDVPVDGVTCARFAILATYQGRTGLSVSLTCRRAGVLYVIAIDNSSRVGGGGNDPRSRR
jgi:hypothetical protein